MTKYAKKLLFILSLYGAFCQAQTLCDGARCPQGRAPTKLCFTDPEADKDWKIQADTRVSCGDGELYPVSSFDEMTKKLDELNTSCKSISNLKLIGHGMSGFAITGNTQLATVKKLSPYSCLFNQGTRLEFVACSVGAECAGNLLMLSLAKSVLAKGGSVYAATAPVVASSGITKGWIPSFSINGTYRNLDYKPTKSPPDTWSNTGILAWKNGQEDARALCYKELQPRAAALQKVFDSAEKRGCDLRARITSKDDLANYSAEFKDQQSFEKYWNSATPDQLEALWQIDPKSLVDIVQFVNCKPATGEPPAAVKEK